MSAPAGRCPHCGAVDWIRQGSDAWECSRCGDLRSSSDSWEQIDEPDDLTAVELDESPDDDSGYLAAQAGLRNKASDDLWMYILSGAAFFAFAFGIWIATQFHPTWVLDVTAGLLAYIPFGAWFSISDNLPRRRLILWPARAISLALTWAIPMTIWIVLHGPPCPPNCGSGT